MYYENLEDARQTKMRKMAIKQKGQSQYLHLDQMRQLSNFVQNSPAFCCKSPGLIAHSIRLRLHQDRLDTVAAMDMADGVKEYMEQAGLASCHVSAEL